MPLSKVKPSTLVAFLCLGIIVVILLFTFCSFDVNADDVITGYNNTRKYAADAKKLQFAVDNFKEEVVERQEDEDARNNFVGVEVSSLGSWDNMLTDSEYEKYTETLIMPADEKLTTTDKPPTSDIVPSAKMGESAISYMTYSGKLNNVGDTTVYMLGSWQCSGFANWFLTKYMYADLFSSTGEFPIYGSFDVTSNAVVEMQAAWKSETNIQVGFQGDGESAKKFFHGVAPGTLVRVDTGKGYDHSYIILGAGTDSVVVYECNQDGCSGIKLTRYTWDAFAVEPRFVHSLIGIMAPPNTNLPTGCTSNEYENMGHIVSEIRDLSYAKVTQ